MPRKNKIIRKRSSRSTPAPLPSGQPLLVGIKAAAAMLGATVWAVRQLLWGRKIPYVKIGRRFLVDPADLRAYIEQQKGRAA